MGSWRKGALTLALPESAGRLRACNGRRKQGYRYRKQEQGKEIFVGGSTMEGKKDSIRWGAVFSGWAMAVLVGVLISPILRIFYGLFTEPPVERGELTAAIVVISLVSGFLSYLLGGYVAARMARYAGGKHGALTAVVGLIVGIILAVILAFFEIVFAEGVALPPAGFGLVGPALMAGLVLFLINLFGGFVGGKLGESPPADVRRAG